MIELINDFVSRFGTSVNLDRSLILEKSDNYFLLSEKLKCLPTEGLVYAGVYLGKRKNEKFIPGFGLLAMIADSDSNKVVVDKKTEWLFVCGRDIFRQGIRKVSGSSDRGVYTLVMNERNECLGFGKVIDDLKTGKKRIVIENMLDVGDFLRRERLVSI